MVDIIKHAFNIEFNDPVIFPASLSHLLQRLVRRLTVSGAPDPFFSSSLDCRITEGSIF